MTAAEMRLHQIEDELETLLEISDIDIDPDARMIHDTLIKEVDEIVNEIQKLVTEIDEN